MALNVQLIGLDERFSHTAPWLVNRMLSSYFITEKGKNMCPSTAR